MSDDWRVRIMFDDLPVVAATGRGGAAAVSSRQPGRHARRPRRSRFQPEPIPAAVPASLHFFRQALIPALGSRLGDQVTVSSSATQIFLYAPSIGLADEAAQVARELLAQHDINAPVRTEFWSLREQKWRDPADDPSADPDAQRHADRQERERKWHADRQEREQKRSVRTGVPAWQGGSKCRRTAM
jgi:hypothetical protein